MSSEPKVEKLASTQWHGICQDTGRPRKSAGIVTELAKRRRQRQRGKAPHAGITGCAAAQDAVDASSREMRELRKEYANSVLNSVATNRIRLAGRISTFLSLNGTLLSRCFELQTEFENAISVF